jgi:GT2 family glycosyltransferase
MTGTLPVSVVVPTVGRPRLLADCLGSISRCDPLPSEVLLVDQSGEPAVADVAERFGARLVVLPQPNVARARNVGLREAREAVMLCTDDDCTVERSWVGTGHQLLQRDPDRIVTGRVLFGGGDPPSLREGETRQEHTGELRGDVLFTNNMAARPRDVLEVGGFDERFAAAAEDNDLCYRWLRAGRRLWFEPSRQTRRPARASSPPGSCEGSYAGDRHGAGVGGDPHGRSARAALRVPALTRAL